MAEISRPEINVVLNDKTKQGTDSVNSNLDKINKKASSLTKAFDKAFGSVKTALFGVGIAGVTSKIIQATRRSSDFIEQLNVLDVAFNDNTKSIREFTSNIAETLNLDDASLIKMASSFKILANSMGYADEMGTKFSKLMTSITTDTASLFNMTLSDTQAMMQSAVQGQTKALRKRTGVSILDRDVQTTLDVLGIDAYVQDMNSAEKSLARVITMTYRLRESQGDLARTIESPANRFRVLSEQISLLARNIGNVFLPTISAILPYLNAVLIVLNKLISSLATLLGFREDAWDTYKAQTDTLSEAFDDLGTSVGGVGNAAKETKKQLNGLRGFDKLNVIKTPTPSSASGGGGGSGINPNLLKAFDTMFDNYKSMLDGVETKATKIANAIMKALGQIDFSNLIASGKRLWEAFKPFAENVGQGLLWVFNNVLKPLGQWTISNLIPTFLDMLADAFIILNNAIETFKPIGEWLWKNFLSPLGKWAGGTIVRTLKDIEAIFRKLSKNKLLSTILTGGAVFAVLAGNIGKVTAALGTTKLGGAISRLISPMKSLYDHTKLYTYLAKKDGGSLIEGIKAGNNAWREQEGIINKVTGKVDGLKGAMNGAKTAITNLALAAVGLEAMKTALDDAAESGWNFGNALGGIMGAFTTISSSITAGAVFGPMGAVIGGLAGTIAVITSAFDTLNGKVKEGDEKIYAYTDSWNRLDEATRNHLETDLAVHDNNLQLIDELDDLTDSNGNVKKSDEDRVNYILHELNDAYGTEYKLIDGKITKNGEQIKSMDEVIEEYKKEVKWMKLKAVAAAYEDDYKEMLKKTKKAAQEVSDAEKNRAEKQSAYDEALAKYNEHRSEENLKELMWADLQKKRADETYEQVSGNYDKLKKDMQNYQDFQSAILKEDYEEALKLSGNFYDNSEDLAKYYAENTDRALINGFKETKDATKNIFDNITKTINSAIPSKKKVKVEADTSSFTSSISNALSKIKVSLTGKANGGILVNNKWRDIATYDTGGLPPVGQMFVARERGPELVGQIGGHTAVMNNNQIVSSVSSGVAQAVRAVIGKGSNNNSVFNIYLDENHKIGSYTLEQLQGMAKSNGKPIRIG